MIACTARCSSLVDAVADCLFGHIEQSGKIEQAGMSRWLLLLSSLASPCQNFSLQGRLAIANKSKQADHQIHGRSPLLQQSGETFFQPSFFLESYREAFSEYQSLFYESFALSIRRPTSDVCRPPRLGHELAYNAESGCRFPSRPVPLSY